MRHLTISDYGTFVGVSSNRLIVRKESEVLLETSLSHLRSVRIEKEGVSFSSNLLLACAARGIRVYLTDWRNVGVVEVGGIHRHAVANVRRQQFACLESAHAEVLAKELILTKIRNQRAVLLYFGKYLKKAAPERATRLYSTAQKLNQFCCELKNMQLIRQKWRDALLGYEGSAAKYYWDTLSEVHLLPETFLMREGRGSSEITNAALNYGYAILQSYVHSALDNAGLELYAGVLHSFRPGKPSLVLDFMEQYRAWVVDRNVISLRTQLEKSGAGLTSQIKRAIVDAIDETMSAYVAWKGKNCRLENILQRQAYQFAGAMIERKSYRGIRFKW